MTPCSTHSISQYYEVNQIPVLIVRPDTLTSSFHRLDTGSSEDTSVVYKRFSRYFWDLTWKENRNKLTSYLYLTTDLLICLFTEKDNLLQLEKWHHSIYWVGQKSNFRLFYLIAELTLWPTHCYKWKHNENSRVLGFTFKPSLGAVLKISLDSYQINIIWTSWTL